MAKAGRPKKQWPEGLPSEPPPDMPAPPQTIARDIPKELALVDSVLFDRAMVIATKGHERESLVAIRFLKDWQEACGVATVDDKVSVCFDIVGTGEIHDEIDQLQGYANSARSSDAPSSDQGAYRGPPLRQNDGAGGGYGGQVAAVSGL
jgi:hypothetical protein